MKKNDFAVFILSHGRAKNVITLPALRKYGYTGDVYIIIDDEDDEAAEYRKIQDVKDVIVFSKSEYIEKSDTMDNCGPRGVVLPARNACFDIAKKLGLKYFLELDDDYSSFKTRLETDGKKLFGGKKTNLDKVIPAYIDFLDASGAKSVCFAQGGDYIGGVGSNLFKKKVLRKAMNSFFCRVDRPFQFSGRLNEDVTSYTTLGMRGELFFTPYMVFLQQEETQQKSGGLTEAYLDLGTYVKSFYSVMSCPSAVKVSFLNTSHRRIHHFIDGDKCYPKIISSKFWKSVS